MKNFIVLNEISKSYPGTNEPVRALNNTTLTIEEGSFVCLIGGSGCGKTTLLNLLAGFEKPDTGTIIIRGELLTRPLYNHQVIFQNYGLLPWRTVLGNVCFALETKNFTKKEREERAKHYIKLVGLTSFEQTYPQQLSGGMKQRVAIARALVAEPDIIFMDEPFGALDAITKMKLQDEILRIRSLTKKTIVMITHDIDEAAYLADRILVMKPNPGTIVEDIDVRSQQPRLRNSTSFVALRTHLLEALDLAVKSNIEYTI